MVDIIEKPQDDLKDFLMKAWKKHREDITMKIVETKNGMNLFYIDQTIRPGDFFMVQFQDGEINAYEGDLIKSLGGDFEKIQHQILSLPKNKLSFYQAVKRLGLLDDESALAQASYEAFLHGKAPKLTARLPREQLIEKEKERFKAEGLDKFLNQFDRNALLALKATDHFELKHYHFYRGDDEKAEIRRQAAKSYPLLAKFYLERPSLRMAIDNKRSLFESLQNSFGKKISDMAIFLALRELREGVPESLVCVRMGIQDKTLKRWIGLFKGKTEEEIGDIREAEIAKAKIASKELEQARQSGLPVTDEMKKNAEIPDEDRPLLGKAIMGRLVNLDWPANGITVDILLRSLSSIPPDWFPKTREDWDAFCDLTATVGVVLRQVTGLSLEILYQGCGGKWVELRNRCAIAFTDTRPPEGVTEFMEARLKKAIPFKELEKIPRDKMHAAILKVVESLEQVSESDTDEDISKMPINFCIPYNVYPDSVTEWLLKILKPDLSRGYLQAACLGAEDMVKVFADKVILPIAGNETNLEDIYLSFIQKQEAILSASQILFSGKSATSIFENVRSFQSRIHEIEQGGIPDVEIDKLRKEEERKMRAKAKMTQLGIPTEASTDAWPPLFAPVQAPNGIWMVCLTENELLKAEGAGYGGNSELNEDGTVGLSHCVGGYGNKAKIGDCHIVSLRVENGASYKRLSTIEFGSIINNPQILTMRQHYGKNNGTPPKEAQRAFDWLVDSIRSGLIPVNHDGIMEYMKAQFSESDDIKSLCQYEWRDRKLILHAMTPWGPFVGKKYRKLGVDEFAKEPEVMTVARQIEPSTGLIKKPR